MLEQFLDQRAVADVDLEQFFAERAAEAVHAAFGLELELVEEDFAGERVAVGVEAGGGEADDGVAGADAICRR